MNRITPVVATLLVCLSSSGCALAIAQQPGKTAELNQEKVLEKPVEALTPGNHTKTLIVEDIERYFIVHVPKSYDKTKPMPLVLAYHGLGLPLAMMPSYCGLDATADKHAFIVVYPGGINTSWNAGGRKGPLAQVRADDVRFTVALLDELEKSLNIDKRRIYATGMSNGAMMCYKLANELSDRIAAIAPVSGAMTYAEITSKRPVPVIHFHGTDDGVVPYADGRDMIGGLISFAPAPVTVAAWAKFDGCKSEPIETALPDKEADGTSVTKKDFGSGKDGAEVVFYTIKGGGHTWPGVKPPVEKLSEKFLGATTYDINANEMIWEFFEKHPMPDGSQPAKARAPAKAAPAKVPGERSI
jgi:polyhydroxybutyrate depolymerase